MIRRVGEDHPVVDLSEAFAARGQVISRMYLSVDERMEVLRVGPAPP
jgi:hypothetical protein